MIGSVTHGQPIRCVTLNKKLKSIQLTAAAKLRGKSDLIINAVKESFCERMDCSLGMDIKYKLGLIYSPYSGLFASHQFPNLLKASSIHGNSDIIYDEENICMKANSFEYAGSFLSLQWNNDIPGTLRTIYSRRYPSVSQDTAFRISIFWLLLWSKNHV